MNNIVEFVAFTHSDNLPVPAVKCLPSWYKKAKKYSNNESTFKNCAPFFESMSSGYVFLTPTDIEFYEEAGIPKFKLDTQKDGYKLDNRRPPFISERSPMGEFQVPFGYYDHHFAWLPEYGLRTPKGYSTLYTTPLNGFSLPFICTSGIINTDKAFQPGSIPFFLQKGYQGIIPKGTPYAQAIPFKREDWVSLEVLITEPDVEHFKPNSPHITNYYRENLWEMSSYE